MTETPDLLGPPLRGALAGSLNILESNEWL